MKIKVKLIIALFCILMAKNVQAEWTKDNGTSLPYANKTCVVNNQVRFAVSGVYVYKTMDGGHSWERDSMQIKMNHFNWISYQNIIFLDNYIGFIQTNLDDSVYIFKTTDGGYSWNRQHHNQRSVNERIRFISEYDWFSNDYRNMHFSTDGGIIWNQINNPLNDTVVNSVEILSSNEWYLMSGNAVYQSSNQGIKWEKLANFNLYKDIDSFYYPHFEYVGMSKTRKGISLLYNVNYAGCGSYYDHSVILDLEFVYFKGWSINSMNKQFNSAPSCIYYRNDTGYISTMFDIYKCTDGMNGWFRTFTVEYYKYGMFVGVGFIDGMPAAWTSDGSLFINNQPSLDKDLAVHSSGTREIKTVVFPNPANEMIIFRLGEAGSTAYRLIITDITGRQVFESTGAEIGDLRIPTVSMNNGIYAYTLSFNNKTETGKFEIIH